MNNKISHEELIKLLEYSPETGIFTWKEKSSKSIKIKDIAGTIRYDGYITIRIKRIPYLAHRLAWFYVNKVWPKNNLDHIDRNPSNNKIDNLRDVPAAINSFNTKIPSTNTSGIKGISKIDQYWQVNLTYMTERFYLGSYKNKQEAINALEKFKEEHNLK